ncbi:mannose-1-phosphate guanylyltransferase/mannose-6-phosphate isomerase [Sphingomonas sp.]|uniref:mannose-1-phosphate guanylyltransferase/mannose-6-phosphate isomerase n=1 Tax=Sphingomonas sp. TaxID=28214 RepID=UPI00389CEBCA
MILCGGAGTRLWPVSRQLFPKQLLPLIGDQSLLQQTAARLPAKVFGPALIVSGEEQRFFIKRQLEAVAAPVDAILLEPAARNTSAAAALAAAWLDASGRDELMLVMPSDHVIGDADAFMAAVAIAIPHAENGAIVTFGARPTEPNTQYGYIEADTSQSFPDGASPIARFVEKPSAAKAAEYVESGRFFWNSGIFLMKPSTLLDEMREFLPASLEAILRAVKEARIDGLFVRPAAAAFAEADNISIDHGVMEKTARGIVVPVEMQWSDVGAWDAVWKLSPKDTEGNAIHGDVVALDTRNSLLRSDGQAMIATVGLDRMAVIAVRDAVFVAPMDRVSEVKELVAGLQREERDCVLTPPKVARPWGSYETIGDGPRFQVKHIIVDPGETLSLQMHFHRSEHWVVVRGSAQVTVGETVSILQENQSTHIPAGTRHRLANPGKVPLELVEIQCGPYLGEDDIVRFDDQYGRAGEPHGKNG